MHRQIAGKLTGRVTKWVVLAVWILIVMAAGSVAGKLTDVQDNQASSWLPASAESTKALDKLAPFQNQNDIPTVLVYEKTSGLTKADLATIGQQLDQIQKLDGAVPAKAPDGTPVQPSQLVQVSKDGQVAQGMVTFNFGKDGWNKLPDVKDQIESIAHAATARTVYVAGPGRPGRRLGRGVRRHRRQAALQHDHRGDRHPAADLPQPAAVAAAGDLGGRGADLRPGA